MSMPGGTRIIDSPVGRLLLVARADGLSHLLFEDSQRTKNRGRPSGDGGAEAAAILDTAERQLTEFFAGRRQAFDLPLAATGTEFQRLVWEGLREIPFGETISYGELARRIGRPRALRAVGAANGANPLPIIMPCHRVIGANGKLTGFGGGLEIKRRLLELEGWRAAPTKSSG